MTLTFEEGGEAIGEVRLVAGQLVGSPPLVDLLLTRMRRDDLDAAAAMRALDGWSNGYLSARLQP